MFSGLIAHLGRVISLQNDPRGGARLVLEAGEALAEGVALGDSIAVNGVCLTVADCNERTVTFEVVPETLQRSTLGELSENQKVNLELSLRLGDRLGGHLFFGHVDATARVVSLRSEGQGARAILEAPERLRRYIVDKGNVALDGVSLTIAGVEGDAFAVALIPETLKRTTFGERKAGDRMNLEIDPIARYAVDGAARYASDVQVTREEISWAIEI